MLTHYLVTRFNIPISEKGPERINFAVMDDLWMKDRINLFLTYCLPSVLAQKNKNFTWLIYFDTKTPKVFLDQLLFLKSQPISIELILVDNFNGMITHMTETFLRSEKKFVISSRLDNDDAISDQFIKIIQEGFIPQHQTVINLTSGYVLDLQKKVFTKWRNKLTNQFSSIIEEKASADLITIYGFPHWRHPDSSTTINIQSKPCWIEIIHKNNNRSRSLLGIPVFSPGNLDEFPEAIRSIDISFFQTLAYGFTWLPKVLYRRLKIFLGIKKI